MKLKAGFVVAFVLCYAVTAFGQQGEIPLPPPATDTIAPDIPGVVKGGTKVQVIVDGLKHTDGPASKQYDDWGLAPLTYWANLTARSGMNAVLDQQNRQVGSVNRADSDQSPHVHEQGAVALNHYDRTLRLGNGKAKRQREREAHCILDVEVLRRMMHYSP
jgi:hypothetical protein